MPALPVDSRVARFAGLMARITSQVRSVAARDREQSLFVVKEMVSARRGRHVHAGIHPNRIAGAGYSHKGIAWDFGFFPPRGDRKKGAHGGVWVDLDPLRGDSRGDSDEGGDRVVVNFHADRALDVPALSSGCFVAESAKDVKGAPEATFLLGLVVVFSVEFGYDLEADFDHRRSQQGFITCWLDISSSLR